MMDIWALIPVKSLRESKRRLAHLLQPAQRAALIEGLLQRELSILNQVPTISRILVISSDPAVWNIARQHGAVVVEETQPLGLNLAVTQGKAIATQNGAAALLILPVDLPFISVSDVELIVSSAQGATVWTQDSDAQAKPQGANGFHGVRQSGASVIICSDEDGEGTNALLLNPAQAFTFHFGPGSFQKHIQEAEERGLMAHSISAPGLSFDLDNERDWYTYQASRVGY